MTERGVSLAEILRSALARSVRTGWFLIKIVVPLSAAIALLQWTGLLARIGGVLAPAMGLFGLPGEAAVALVAGGFLGVWSAIAAASAIPMTAVQMTVLALMVLTAHNLIVESAVQSRSGASGLKVSLVRIAASLCLGAGLWQVLRHADQGATVTAQGIAGVAHESFAAFAAAWATHQALLIVKIFGILFALMIATEMMRAWGVIDALAGPMRPVMRLLGLSERVTLLWLTGVFLGVAYGAGLIVEEARERGRFRPGDLRDLHVSLGLSHSLLEDTLLFVAVGAHPLWILAPRPVVAAAVVRAVRRFVRVPRLSEEGSPP